MVVKNCPTTNGRIIEPPLDAENKYPVNFPLSVIRRSANASIVGNTEAIESPKIQLATHKTGTEDDQIRIALTLTKQPIKSVIKIVRGLNLLAKNIASNLPKVKTNKNVALILYAALLSPSPASVVYVLSQLITEASNPV